jgi:cyclic pyranopterin phosphate synthase
MSTPHTHNSDSRLSHIDGAGKATMVDVGAKAVTERFARAEGFVVVSEELERQIRGNMLAKGSLLDVARLAGIMSAKQTASLIPLCHTLPLDRVDVCVTVERGRVRVEASASVHARTGVEMEALTAVAVACLTVIDMGKAVDRAMRIEGIRVIEKRGGRTGSWRAPDAAPATESGA